MKVVKKRTIVISHIFLILGALFMLYPLAFAFLGQFVSIEGFYEVGVLPVPQGFSYLFSNLGLIFRRTEIYVSILLTLPRFVWYSFILIFTSVLGGYAFAKVKFKFKKAAFYIIMSSMMIPGIALLVPQYLELMRFPLVGGNDILGKGGSGFRDNPALLFITGCFSAYNIFLVRQMLTQMGNEYKEAAEIDGAGFFRIIFSIYMPMLTPVIALMVVQTFIGQWNDYLFPMIFLSGARELWPIGVLSVKIQSDYLSPAGTGGGLMNYPMVMTMGVVMMIPPIVAYICCQKYFVQGLAVGGIKA